MPPTPLPPADQQSLLTICNAHAHLYADTKHISTAQFWIRVATEFNRELGRTPCTGARDRGRGRGRGRGQGEGRRAETPTEPERKGPSLSGSAARSWVGYLVDGYYRERERGGGGRPERRRRVDLLGHGDRGGSEPQPTTTTTTTNNNPPHQSRSPSVPRASEGDSASEPIEEQIVNEHAPKTTTTTTTPLQQWIATYERFGHLRGYVPPGRPGGGGPAWVFHGDGDGDGEVQLPPGVKMEVSHRPGCRCHRGQGGRGVHYSLA
ncbi:hypothetical protein FQN52_007083 [Onygenales sp. PD_12]|nr:hypothetical protein FQN52_007083 [Onygenales sp. PD_12]